MAKLNAQNPEAVFWEIREKPAWVHEVSFEKENHENGDQPGGVVYLLHEEQVRIQSDTLAHFMRYARQIVNTAGLETLSHFTHTFKGAYERVVLHEVYLIRQGKRINLLPECVVRVIDTEAELHHNMMDQTKTLHLLLEDLRVGDIFVSSLTQEGWNPVFQHRYCGLSRLNFGQKVYST